MLITTKINDCPGCKDLGAIVDELDCYIAAKGLIYLNNIKYSLTKKVNKDTLDKAIRYKRILIARSFNPSYGCASTQDIINKAKQIIYGM